MEVEYYQETTVESLSEGFPEKELRLIARSWRGMLAVMTETSYKCFISQMSQGQNIFLCVSEHANNRNGQPTPDEEYAYKWASATMFARVQIAVYFLP
jgi:hypothetical protein